MIKITMKNLKEFDVKNKRVLVRCDFNVPLDRKGEQTEVSDDFKIRESLATIEYLIREGAKVILMSHLGRPKKGENLSLRPVALKLKELLKKNVKFSKDCLGRETEKEIAGMKAGEVMLLENLRFYEEEEAGDLDFAGRLAELGDIYINDAFGASHRSHASIVGITKFLPSGAGFLLQKEVEALSKILNDPERPLVAVIGGAKIETKIMVIKKFLEKADHLLLGGKIANSVLAVKGIWLFGEPMPAEAVREIKKIDLTSIKLHLPVDVLICPDGRSEMKWEKRYVSQSALAKVEENELLLDIGKETIDIFSKIIKEARTIVWSGPLGLSENPLFENGTKETALAIAGNRQAFKVAGGGETAQFINKNGLKEKFDHLSTGGGAMLEFLSGRKFPGIEALE